MRILHLDSGREMRGGQWQALYLMDGLRCAGHECVLLSPRNSPLAQRALAAGVQIGILRPLTIVRAARASDLVHAHCGRSHTLASVLVRRPVVVSRRVAFLSAPSLRSKFQYSRAAHYIAVSEYVRRLLIDRGLRPDRVTVIHDAVPLPDRASQRDGDLVALDSSDPLKGGELLRSIAQQIPVRLSSDLPSDLSHARVFLYVTESEGLGSAALLAMSYGVPVVASDVEGLREVVVDGATGLLVPNTAPGILAGVRTLLEDHELAARMGMAGRQRVEQKFSLARLISETIEVYKKALTC
ncbi:MAG: glycosyltransferase family 4 protein [Bryobacteraceae bacterium]|nr:glycosyltransferase family 4 protein [Bryobacteraceae bacterium]